MNQNYTINETSEIQALRDYLQNKFKSSFFGGLSLDNDYQYITGIHEKYPENPSALIARGYLEWRFGNRANGEMLFEKAYKIARETNYVLQWFETGINTFLGSSNDDCFINPTPLLPEFQHVRVATNKRSLILASCDDRYFQDFGRSFVGICLKHSSGSVHIHVINPSEKTLRFFEQRKGGRVSFSIETSNNTYPSYYATSRFLIAPSILETYDLDILIVDIDQAIARDIDLRINAMSRSDNDVAVPILKTSWMPWNYALATNVFIKNNDHIRNFLRHFASYVEQAARRLGGYEGAWFIDQNAMFRAISILERRGASIGNIQQFGRIAIGPAGQGKKFLAKLLHTYNGHVNFLGRSKLTGEDEFLSTMKVFLKHKDLAFMFLESFYRGTK